MSTDFLLWVVLAMPLPLGGQGVLADSGDSVWSAAGWVLLVAVIVGLSRVAPLLSLCLSTAAILVNPWFVPAMVVMSYLAGLRLSRTRAALIVVAVIVGSGAVLANILAPDVAVWLGNIAILLVAVVVPWLFGRYWRQYQELNRAGWARAEDLEREQRIVAEQARLRERTRIAQDMHDSLGHELSLVALRAGGLEVAPDLEDRHRTAARELRSAAANATEHLRGIIGVLRDESGSAPLEPVEEGISELVERAGASGMAVTLQTDDTLEDLSRPETPHAEREGPKLPPMVERAAYRVVQESLTNATKHAPGAAVTVRLAHTATETFVTVTNDAPSGGPPTEDLGNRGLAGLRERVRLVGGTLEAGAQDGGFEVAAHLPHHAVAMPYDHGTVDTEQSESARQLALARQRARRGLLTAIVVPASLATGLAAIAMGYYLYVAYSSVLTPAEFDRLRVGQDRAQVASVLPSVEMLDPPTRPAPPGATCQYYESQASPFARFEVYRLCFAHGQLVVKDVLSTRTYGTQEMQKGMR